MSCATPAFTRLRLRSRAIPPRNCPRQNIDAMPKPLLYKPPPRWHVWTALGAAALIHIGAVVAAFKHEKPVDLTDIPTAMTIDATIEQPSDEPTPPPEDIPLPEPPPVPEVQPEFHEETTPPPKRPPNVKVAPV